MSTDTSNQDLQDAFDAGFMAFNYNSYKKSHTAQNKSPRVTPADKPRKGTGSPLSSRSSAASSKTLSPASRTSSRTQSPITPVIEWDGMIEIGDGRVLTCQQVCTDILLKALGGKLNTQVGLSGSRWANTANNESKPMVKETKTDIVQSKEGMKKKKDMVASNIVEDLGKAIEVFDATAYGRGK